MIRRVALLSLHSSPLAPIGSADAGGMNVYVRRLADELNRRGLHTDVFTRRIDPQSPSIVRTASGARIIHLSAGPTKPLPKRALSMHIPSLAGALREFVARDGGQYDLLHSHYWLSGLVALRYRDWTNVPVMHMFHTLAKVKEFYLGQPDPSDSAWRVEGERQIVAEADMVIGATSEEQEFMERLYGVRPSVFDVIPPGVDLDVFRPQNRRRCREELHIRGDRVILFVGRPDRIKGLELLLRAVAELPEEHLRGLKVIVVGAPHAGPSTSFSGRLVSALGLEGVVEFRGLASQDDLARYYSAADLCAVPSAYESFGMAAVESMACETPVVAFRVGGLAATIADRQTGFLAARRDLHCYSRTLKEALESRDLSEMGRRARYGVRKYAWSAVVLQTINAYARVAKADRASYRRSRDCPAV